MPKIIVATVVLLIFISSCGTKTIEEVVVGNPAGERFDLDNSDARAIAIADEVMEAMGGRTAWDNTRYISWEFFGSRKHTWDKQSGMSRIESPKDSLISILNLGDNTGMVQKAGVEITDEDQKAELLKNAKSAWINDSYWLVMPFKLKDDGVTLKYAGRDTTIDGRSAEKLTLTFTEVGVTPDNMYSVYVDDETKLVTQWDYFSSSQDTLPRFQSPWPEYEKYGNIMLSGGQIGGRKMENITVLNELSPTIFSKF